jgi:hypothetical protein
LRIASRGSRRKGLNRSLAHVGSFVPRLRQQRAQSRRALYVTELTNGVDNCCPSFLGGILVSMVHHRTLPQPQNPF